jgi:hypothetical protein
MTKPTGIEEVVALEDAIRAGLPLTAGALAADARAIMGGKFPRTGTRLAALKDIVERMGR